jgi:hypothetical protein
MYRSALRRETENSITLFININILYYTSQSNIAELQIKLVDNFAPGISSGPVFSFDSNDLEFPVLFFHSTFLMTKL